MSTTRKNLGPHDVLAAGTKVRVQNLLGEVITHHDLKDQHGKPIVVHSIRYTHRMKRTFAGKATAFPLAKPVTGQGGITLKISTHAFGTIQLALTDATFTDLMFGLSETVVPIARVLPNRCPSYPRPSPI